MPGKAVFRTTLPVMNIIFKTLITFIWKIFKRYEKRFFFVQFSLLFQRNHDENGHLSTPFFHEKYFCS